MFNKVKNQVLQQFNTYKNDKLFKLNCEKDELYNVYLSSFPEELRQEYTCNACRSFINQFGDIVSLRDNVIHTMWDIDAEYPFNLIMDNMTKLIKSKQVSDIFVVDRNTVLGVDKNKQRLENGDIIEWEHWCVTAPKNKHYAQFQLVNSKTSADVAYRSLNEISIESLETILDFIKDGAIYRGKEFENVVKLFLKHSREYNKLNSDQKIFYAWNNFTDLSTFKNSVIGTLAVNLSSGMSVEKAVATFESYVAPTNYKRPKPLVSKKDIENAEKTIKELGLEEALHRRHANILDINIKNILYIKRDSTKAPSLFDDMKSEVTTTVKDIKQYTDIGIDKFIDDVLPNCNDISILFESRLKNNFVNILTSDSDIKLFQWSNPFSWSYVTNTTDSVKEKVKSAGGSVDGVLRISLEWFNYDDLDLSIVEPDGYKIYYGAKHSNTGGFLDVDMNAGTGATREPVENIIYKTNDKLRPGVYSVFVHNFRDREKDNNGFNVEIEFGGQVYHYTDDIGLRDNDRVKIADLKYDNINGFSVITAGLSNSTRTETIYGLTTNQWIDVSTIMNSPNYWDDFVGGNKHVFFMLKGALNDDKIRGIYNEYLRRDLIQHKRVFEVIGNKTMVGYDEKQLMGLGFSDTMKNNFYCKVKTKQNKEMIYNVTI